MLPENLPDAVASEVSLLKPVGWPCMAQVASLQLKLLMEPCSGGSLSNTVPQTGQFFTEVVSNQDAC